MSDYKQASDTLRMTDLRQPMKDDGFILMDKVLVNLQGTKHRNRPNVETKVFHRDFFYWYGKERFPTTLNETLYPYLDSGKLGWVDFGFRIKMNLTAVLFSVDRPRRTADETTQLVRVLRTLGNRKEIRAKIRQELLEFDSTFFWIRKGGARASWRNLNEGKSPRMICPGTFWSSS